MTGVSDISETYSTRLKHCAKHVKSADFIFSGTQTSVFFSVRRLRAAGKSSGQNDCAFTNDLFSRSLSLAPLKYPAAKC